MLIKCLESIEAAPRGNARLEAIGQAIQEGGETVKKFLVMANNPFVTFGVAKLPKPADGGLFFQDEAQWSAELFGISEALAARRLTGNEAKARLAAFLDDCNEPQKKWSQRFLLKDLRLNIGAKEIQKFVGKRELPLFEVPLAHDYQDFRKWAPGTLWVVEPKLDGGRCVAVIDRLGTVELFSRSGKTWGNFESIRGAIQKWATVNGIANYVLDGEVVSLTPEGRIDFQQIQKTMMRKDGVEVGELQYVVFDGCKLSEWQEPELSYGQRLAALEKLIKETRFPKQLRLVETQMMGGIKENIEAAAKVFVEAGYEGAIARRHDAVVQNKRSKDLLKVKTFQDAEAIVTGFVEGTGKYVGKLGAMKCRLAGVGVEFEVGSGYSDALRDDIWANTKELMASIVVFKYFELTDDGVPRFPVFKGFRSKDDVGGVE